MVTVLSSSSVYSRQTNEHGRQEDGWCLMHVIPSRNTTVPHLPVPLVIIHELKHTIWVAANMFILFLQASLHLCFDYLENVANEEKLGEVNRKQGLGCLENSHWKQPRRWKNSGQLAELNIQNFEVQWKCRCLFLGLLVEKG